MQKKNFYGDWLLGLDIGTNSVGWAVTDTGYNILKYKSNAMWGVHLFDPANQCEDRRSFRTSRRRLDRRQQRISLLQDLMAKPIAEVDSDFFIRLKQSALYPEDRSTGTQNIYFNDINYADKEYFSEYPTIHHLIDELMKDTTPHDVRLVYLACAYILAHRGHFLFSVDKDNISEVLDFDKVYQVFTNWFNSADKAQPWECSSEKFAEILKRSITKTAKEREFKLLLWDGKKPTLTEESAINPVTAIKLIVGGKAKLSDLFLNESDKELETNSITFNDDNFDGLFESLIPALDDGDSDLLASMKAIYDWSLLSGILKEKSCISEAKKEIYEQHKSDLAFLKYAVKKYIPKMYDDVFRIADSKLPNYLAYSYNTNDYKSKNKTIPSDLKKASPEDFCKYIKDIFKKTIPDNADLSKFEDMLNRLDLLSFCPKQVNSDNRVIPYQLYWYELNLILNNASTYLNFLNDSDEYSSVKDKILSLMEFRIPYYVGPLVSSDKSNFAWMKRKAEGKIYPWNFKDMVDEDASEEEFIRRMTCKCTYLPGKNVLPKNSLLYCRFNVLNEINNIKINNKPITVECKKLIYNEVFLKHDRVTLKHIKDTLRSHGCYEDKDAITGIDITVKSSLKPLRDFKPLLESGMLTEEDAERIIEKITFSNDKLRIKKWLKENYTLSDKVIKKIAKSNYKDFGRLSREFLTEVFDIDPKTGEVVNPNIITMLWETNKNLMELLSQNYGYSSNVKKQAKEYYNAHPKSIIDRLNEMYISNAVKRPILRTLDIVKELKHIMPTPPKRIFIEMARGEGEKKRTKSRRDLILEMYKNYGEDEVGELKKQLSSKADGELRSERLFLYFTQLGRSMYSGKSIDISNLASKAYDVDHIHPRSRKKDDSLDNKVLVLSEENAKKGDKYPISSEIRHNMKSMWEKLAKGNLISKEKLHRLERDTEFTDEELAGFINRQIVETQQSTKAIAHLLEEMFPDTQIVYVKARLVSEFRQTYDMLKCRSVNDLHHAKDAYLNIVMGNVQYVKYTNNPLNFIKSGQKYSLKLDSLLKHDIIRGNDTAWLKDGSSLTTVKNTMEKNNIRFVRYSSCQKGELFNIMPLKKGLGQISLKKDNISDISKYGGYNSATSTYFYLVKHMKKDKVTISFVPIDLIYAGQLTSKQEVLNHLCEKHGLIEPELLLGGRKIKYNTLLEIDGFRSHLTCKTNDRIKIKRGLQLILPYEWEKYIKRIETYNNRNSEYQRLNKKTLEITVKDEITKEKNVELYNILMDKLKNTKYNVFKTPSEIVKKGKEVFETLNVEEQSIALFKMLGLFNCTLPSGIDLKLIGGSQSSAILSISMDLNKKSFSSIKIIDQSPTGLFLKKSPNLLDL